MHAVELETTDSTNDECRRRILGGASAPLLIIAREQTRGRGTRGRSWASPLGAGLYFSLGIQSPVDPIARPGLLTIAAGIACAETLRDELGIQVCVKPINDLMVNGAKLGGILTESFAMANQRFVIIGIGINVASVAREVERDVVAIDQLLPPGQFAGVDVAALPRKLAGHVARWISIAAGDVSELRRAWTTVAADGAMLPARM